MRLSVSLALSLSASLGALSACLVELHPSASCGDGFIDRLAGEQCEPGDVASYEPFCASLGGTARDSSVCDPDRCVLVASACDLCGNGRIDAGEQCDGDDLNGGTCPGPGAPTCRFDCTLDTSTCQTCGNGELDVDEECDPGPHPGSFAGQIPCTNLVSPAGVSRRYGSGVATQCTSGCLWDRSNCSYCMNDQLDGAAAVDFEGKITLEPEVCDEDVAAVDLLRMHCQTVCGSNYTVECNYKCASDCRDFDVAAVPADELDCCTSLGEACPYDENGNLLAGRVPCCWEQGHPGDEPCQAIFNNGTQTRVCR